MNYEILEDMFYYHNKYRNVDIHSIGCELSTWDVEHIIDEPYQDTYEQLYLQLLSNRNNSKVCYIMKDLLENQ